MAGKNSIRIDDTRFIYQTNFSGDPERDNYGSDKRKANLIIPTEAQAMELREMGVNVRATKPRPGEEENFVPTYFVAVNVNYDSDWPPRIFLVTGDAEPVLMDEESVGTIDKIYVTNVCAILNPYTNERTGRTSLYVKTMYVEQDLDDDPYAARYRRGER